MAVSLSAAVDLLTSGQFAEAEAALAPLVGPSRTGIIARFRHAEALSRLERHDEACAEAAQAAEVSHGLPAAPLWLAWTLAEAGRYAEAAAVNVPGNTVESLEDMRQGFAALARLAADDRTSPAEDAEAVLETRHAPLYSLALRAAESWRLARRPRWPDLPAVWGRIECGLEMEYDQITTHPETPKPPKGGEASRAASRWLRFHAACGDFSDLVQAIRAGKPVPDTIDEAELEMLLALGRLDAAQALTERLSEELGDDAAGELAVGCARLALLRGDTARVEAFPGHEDARKRLGSLSTWIDLDTALIDGDAPTARTAADTLADPSRREFVEAALRRWSDG